MIDQQEESCAQNCTREQRKPETYDQTTKRVCARKASSPHSINIWFIPPLANLIQRQAFSISEQQQQQNMI